MRKRAIILAIACTLCLAGCGKALPVSLTYENGSEVSIAVATEAGINLKVSDNQLTADTSDGTVVGYLISPDDRDDLFMKYYADDSYTELNINGSGFLFHGDTYWGCVIPVDDATYLFLYGDSEESLYTFVQGLELTSVSEGEGGDDFAEDFNEYGVDEDADIDAMESEENFEEPVLETADDAD